MSRRPFRVNPHSIVAWILRNSLLKGCPKSEGEVTASEFKPRSNYFLNGYSTILPKWPNDWAVFRVLIFTVHLAVCSFHVTYAFQNGYTILSCQNVKELLARSRCTLSGWSDCNRIRTHNHLVLKPTLNHSAKLTKWLSCVLNTYLYGAFDCIFLSCQVRISEWIHTLQLPECQGTPCPKQVRNLKVKWLQPDSKVEALSS